MQVQQLIPLWRVSLAQRHSCKTVETYTYNIDRFVSYLGGNAQIADITPQRIAAFQRSLAAQLAPSTHALYLTAIRSFCRYLIAAELRIDDPTIHVVYPRIPARLPRALALEQVRELLAALVVPTGLRDHQNFLWRRNRLAIHLMLYAGLRISETWSLRWADVSLLQRRLIVRAGKGGKDRAIPIHPVLLGELEQAPGRDRGVVVGHRNGKGLAEKSLHHVFERWVPRVLKLSFDLESHQLRHTFITRLIDCGASIFDAQDLAGHESPETTKIYYRASAAHLRSAVERLVW